MQQQQHRHFEDQMTPALMPINCRRALPSKWDDAERWITSPISGNNNSAVAQPHGKKPKSKSGPLVVLPSPVQGYNFRNTAAIVVVSSDSNSETDHSLPNSSSEPVRLDPVCSRDVGTQMSPPNSSSSSSSHKETTSESSLLPSWRSVSKLRRDEARIVAWENLQKAKAEAAMRKLDMDLEKKRSTSMDRISGKLRAAQKKAQEMRTSLSKEPQQRRIITRRRPTFFMCSCSHD